MRRRSWWGSLEPEETLSGLSFELPGGSQLAEVQRCVGGAWPVLTRLLCFRRDYAESVGRKVRDLGMVVDLIFLNTEVSLSQALEDVSRGGSPFAIVITQQHQIHRSCTVNIMFGTPQGTEAHVAGTAEVLPRPFVTLCLTQKKQLPGE